MREILLTSIPLPYMINSKRVNDANEVEGSGHFMVHAETLNLPPELKNYSLLGGSLLQLKWDSNSIKQIVYPVYGECFFMRVKTKSEGWKYWDKFVPLQKTDN